MSIVLPVVEIFSAEEITRDILFPSSLSNTGTCTFSRNSSRHDLGVMEISMKLQKEYVELPE